MWGSRDSGDRTGVRSARGVTSPPCSFIAFSPPPALTIRCHRRRRALRTRTGSARGFDAYVARSVKDWNVPGLAIAVVKDDSTVFAKGYGVRQLGTHDSVDTTRSSRMRRPPRRSRRSWSSSWPTRGSSAWMRRCHVSPGLPPLRSCGHSRDHDRRPARASHGCSRGRLHLVPRHVVVPRDHAAAELRSAQRSRSVTLRVPEHHLRAGGHIAGSGRAPRGRSSSSDRILTPLGMRETFTDTPDETPHPNMPSRTTT